MAEKHTGFDALGPIKLSNGKYPIAGDATSGRILRKVLLTIENGTNASTLKCTVADDWNGDTIAETDNIAKNATTGNFTLDADGKILDIEASGLSGNCLMALGTISHNATGIAGLTPMCDVSTNDIRIRLRDGGVDQDITVLVDTGIAYIEILYITDA